MNDQYLTAEEVHNYDQAFAESETALGMIIAGYLERLEAGRKDGIPESAITVSMAIFLEKWEPGPLSSVLSVAIVALARKFQSDEDAEAGADTA